MERYYVSWLAHQSMRAGLMFMRVSFRLEERKFRHDMRCTVRHQRLHRRRV